MTAKRAVLHTTPAPHSTANTEMGHSPAQPQHHRKDTRPMQHSSSPGRTQRFRAFAPLLLCFLLGILTCLLFIVSGNKPIHMMETLHSLPEHISSQSMIMGGSIIATMGITIAAVFLGLAFFIVNTLIHPKRNDHFIPLTPFVLDFPAEEVTFPPLHGNHLVRGLYIPRHDATTTILVSPGYRRTFLDVLGMCKHLWAAGHTVLVFEYYGHGTIVGVPITLGYREVNDFLGAVPMQDNEHHRPGLVHLATRWAGPSPSWEVHKHRKCLPLSLIVPLPPSGVRLRWLFARHFIFHPTRSLWR